MLLQAIRILDLTRLLPGPFCSMLLADLGCDVVKVEEPERGDYMRYYPPLRDGQSVAFNAINRNKRSLTINLKSEAGRDLFRRLAARADVVIEGNRPGVMERLGLGWRQLHEHNPKLVLCSITGFGQNSPWALRAGHDLNYMAIAGALGLNATAPDAAPHPLSMQVADIGAGAQGAATAILGALLEVALGGEGRHLDVSMTDGALSWLAVPLSQVREEGQVPERARLRLTGRYACYRVYRTGDGRFYSVGALEPKFWEELCAVLERPDLVARQYAEGDEQAALQAELEEIFASRTRDEWQELLGDRDVCCEPVLELDEVASHPHVRARGLLSEQATGLEVAPAVPLDPGWRRRDPPRLGEHTAEILAEVGVGEDRLAELRAGGVV